MRDTNFKIVLIGNPNAGKSTVFNNLTGLRQKVGNFPGVTVDKKVGAFEIENKRISVIDLPGTYSLYPNSADERIVLNILTNDQDDSFPDAIVYIADATQLERHLLLYTQLRDLNIPTILCVNMMDIANENGIAIDLDRLSEFFNTEVIALTARSNEGTEELKRQIYKFSTFSTIVKQKMFYQPQQKELDVADKIRFQIPEVRNTYRAILLAHHVDKLPFLNKTLKTQIENANHEVGFEDLRSQIMETLQRFNTLQPLMQQVFKKEENSERTFTDVIDDVVTHSFWGPVLFFGILFFMFQAIFTFAEIPKNGIETIFIYTNTFIKEKFGDFWLTDLFTNGILAGLSGVLAFVPQILILFFFITLLEEVGYMARAVYLFDRVMQKVGLNGRSIVALVAGGACAIPAIMSTRTISNKKERLITILVTPFISCSARIPVYTLLVGFVVQNSRTGIFNEQGLVFTGLYLLGITTALGASFVLKKILKTEENTFLALELPSYKLPHWRNVFLTLYEKVKTFVTQAGSTIMVVSIILWFLSTFSPTPQRVQNSLTSFKTENPQIAIDSSAFKNYRSSEKLKYSFAGYLGKAIEPAIRPLGFDWKIGIALLSSFAAREVFVGTMATIYSVGESADNTDTIKDKMLKEKRRDGTPLYSLATSLSLLIFYVFALQCMSTLAVVQRETKSWFWPIVQFIFMSMLAYVSSFIVFSLFS